MRRRLWLHAFVISALNGSGRHQAPAALPPEKNNGNQEQEAAVDPTVGLYILEKIKFFCSYRNTTLESSSPYSIRYMDYDTPSSYKVVEAAKKRPSFNKRGLDVQGKVAIQHGFQLTDRNNNNYTYILHGVESFLRS